MWLRFIDARKIRELLMRRQYGEVRVPAKGTVHATLDRHGLVQRAQRSKNRAQGTPLVARRLPQEL